MKRMLCALFIMAFLLVIGCGSKKPENEAIDAKDRVKSKVEGIRDGQQKAAEETGVADPSEESEQPDE